MKTFERTLQSKMLDAFSFQTDDETADVVVDWFGRWLENYISGGAEIQDGQTLQVGYTIVRCSVDSRMLHLESPTFDSMPIAWNANMGPALQIIGWHKFIPESFSLTPDMPTLRQTAIVGQHFNEYPMFGSRLEATNANDSGWFFGSMLDTVDNNDPDQLSTMSLYEAMLSVPQMVPYLSMPENCQIMFSSKTPEIRQDGRLLDVKPGSMVEMLYNGH